jgi:hypothetical protein
MGVTGCEPKVSTPDASSVDRMKGMAGQMKNGQPPNVTPAPGAPATGRK